MALYKYALDAQSPKSRKLDKLHLHGVYPFRCNIWRINSIHVHHHIVHEYGTLEHFCLTDGQVGKQFFYVMTEVNFLQAQPAFSLESNHLMTYWLNMTPRLFGLIPVEASTT